MTDTKENRSNKHIRKYIQQDRKENLDKQFYFNNIISLLLKALVFFYYYYLYNDVFTSVLKVFIFYFVKLY